MGTFGEIAIGARGQFEYSEETAWGSPLAPTQRINFKTESMNNEIGNLLSEALDPTRGTTNRVRGVSNISGDVAIELNTEGYEVLYKHAFGDALSITACDGGVRTRITTAFTTPGTTLTVENTTNFKGAPTTGYALVAVYKGTDGLMTSTAITYSAVAGPTSFTITDPLVNLPKGAWIFQTAATHWAAVYTHVIEVSKTLPAGLTLEVGRDVAFFVYSGCKVNTLENTYNSQEILQGTVGFVGKAEYSGGDLSADILAAAVTFTLKNYTLNGAGTQIVGFPLAGGTIQIGAENGITYTAYTPSTGVFTGVSGITIAHKANEPIVGQIPWGTVVVPPTTKPLSSFQAAVYVTDETGALAVQEVLSGSWTLNNNLYTDKYQLGDRFRAGLPEQQRTVEGLIHVEFDNLRLYHKFINGTSHRLEFRSVDDSETINTSGNTVYRQFHVLFSKIEFTGTTPQIGGPEMIEHDQNFTALRDLDYNVNEVVAIFVNEQNRGF